MDYSDDDMLDASDSELIYDEDLYSEDCADSDGSDADYDFGNKEEVIKQRDERFIILKEEDIKKRQEENITNVSNILSISREHALVLLRHFKWDESKVNDEWFANEEAVRKSVGLQLETPVQIIETQKIKCGICFEEFPSDKIGDAACGHKYCFSCWQGYIGAAINDGPGSLNLRCPDPSCSVLITQDIINKLAKDEDKEKYARYVLRSYVEDNKKTKWCPSPGCESAVEFMGNNNYDVFCACSFAFCWNCAEEAHRPVDCTTVAKWILKNCAESENMNWILANSKPCPKCKRPIEKNQGCMHMTCTPPCKFEFCWLCLTAWSEHGERTGGFYACNSYESAKKQGAYDEAERRREMAKNSLEKYTHYYERWASNQTSRVKALGDLNDMKTKKIAELSNNIREPETHLKFIIDAWQQIVECRRVLKWTYAYGYYLPENEVTKRQFFEYLQGEAETALERLHMCAEKELQHFLLIEDPVQKPVEDFGAFRVKLAGLTSVTKNFFENLVRALENGLEDVNSITSTSNQTSTSKNTKGKNGKNNKSSKNGSNGSTRKAVPGVTDDDQWACERCTYANPVTSDTCQMCTQHT